MSYSIENIELCKFPLGFPNSLLMVCQDYPDSAGPGEQRPLMIALGDPTHGWEHRFDLLALSLTHGGSPVAFETLTTPAGIKATSEYGILELCFEDNMCLRMRTSGEIGLSFFIKFRQFEQFYDRCDGSVVASFRPLSGDFLLEALKGSQTYETAFLPDESRSADTYVRWAPEDGSIEGYISFREHGVHRRTFVRTIDQCFRDNMDNFRDFCAKTYKCPNEKIRQPFEVSEYMIWCSYMKDYGAIKGYAVNMCKGGNMRYAKGWHQAMQGMAAWRNLDFALGLIYQIPGLADEYGMAPGGVSTISAQYTNPMAPIQGWALSYVVKRHGGWNCLSDEWAEKMYDALTRWTNWWREFSDINGDGIVGYTNSDSSGWNDATMFAGGVPATTPDISAWLIVQTEACGNLAKRLGKNNEADYWFDCSHRMLDDMISHLWDGEKFVVINDLTGEIPMNWCIALYQVVMLGKRLPQEIIDKLVATLSDTTKFLAPQGFTTEAMDSPYYDVIHLAMMHGRIFAMANLYVIFGLYQCGAVDFATDLARIWSEQMIELGPQTIVPGPPQTWEPMKIEEQVFNVLPSKMSPASLSTWGCGVYLNIADMLNEDFCC